jgi:hypothetical protein
VLRSAGNERDERHRQQRQEESAHPR